MKQKLFLSLLVLALGSLPALANEPLRIFLNAGKIEHVNLQNDMEVVLVQAFADNQSVVLDPQVFEKLNMRLNNNTLFISSKNGSEKEQTVVYLYVNNLKSLTVDGSIQVKTMGALNSKKLDLFVGGNSKVHVLTNGVIKAHSLDESEVDVKYISKTSPAKRGY